ncbi:type V CRISPR-associated endonuclease Cas1 [Candidatus Dependentiae bacterium]|nr:type V CRISPR-associated endonuclease Cas1 [Candidatus Dependentiae bacterium]
MLTLDNFLKKQILFVDAIDIKKDSLKIRNENIALLNENRIVNQVSIHRVISLFILGHTTLSSKVIENCVNNGISIFFLNYNFSQYAYINSSAEGNFILRQKQYVLFDDLALSKQIVKNKILNQLRLLKKEKKLEREKYFFLKKENFRKIDNAKDNKELLGLEGSLSKLYFKGIFKEYGWYKRMPRAKIDEINFLLDIGYTFLFNFIDSLIGLFGFDKYKGFYHTQFFNRKSLTCDLVEPFRCIVDKAIIKAFHLNQIDKRDFKRKGNYYYLKWDKNKKYSKIFFKEILNNKEDIYDFVRGFYKYTQAEKAHKFPNYLIK